MLACDPKATPARGAMLSGRLGAYQWLPPSRETTRAAGVIAITICPAACTAMKSRCPRTAPPRQLWPPSALENSPWDVAANHASGATSRSATRPFNSWRTGGSLAGGFVPSVAREPARWQLAPPAAGGSWARPLTARQALSIWPQAKTPRLVPASRVPSSVWRRLKISCPARPSFICAQCSPASRETNSPPYSLSLTTPA